MLCTDAAAEGLNFQFCGAVINYDMPWNPMRVEQRIGRIDRVGQTNATIRIVNLHYEGTVETDVYRALRTVSVCSRPWSGACNRFWPSCRRPSPRPCCPSPRARKTAWGFLLHQVSFWAVIVSAQRTAGSSRSGYRNLLRSANYLALGVNGFFIAFHVVWTHYWCEGRGAGRLNLEFATTIYQPSQMHRRYRVTQSQSEDTDAQVFGRLSAADFAEDPRVTPASAGSQR